MTQFRILATDTPVGATIYFGWNYPVPEQVIEGFCAAVPVDAPVWLKFFADTLRRDATGKTRPHPKGYEKFAMEVVPLAAKDAAKFLLQTCLAKALDNNST